MKILLKYSTLLLSAFVVANAATAQVSGLNDPINQDKAGGVQAADKFQDPVNTAWRPSLVSEGAIDRVKHDNRALDWATIREIDIAFKRTVWQRIDIRQKQNQAFTYIGDEYSGGGAFIEILIDAVKKGKMRAFADDKFTTVLEGKDLDEKLGGGTVTTEVEDPITGAITYVTRQEEFNPASIVSYEIKEIWIFDRNTGRLIPRILSISPLKARINEETGVQQGVIKMFTIYYPEVRNVLAQYEVYNPENDIRRISWSDYFDGRYFSSYIMKTSRDNFQNSNITNDIDGLMRGQQEFERIIAREQDMWEQ